MAGDKNPSWRGGHAGYRGPSWPRQRKLALERDGYKCVKCGVYSRIVNHKIPFRFFATHEQANHLSNLETMCRKHHTKKDNEVWASMPLFTRGPRFPNCDFIKKCESCEKEYLASSPHQKRCNECSTFTCDVCGKKFISRKRPGRFCSRKCNVSFRKKEAKWSRKCLICGKKIMGGRLYCRDCWLKDPAGLVRPGHKPGRRPKDPNVISI